MSTAAPTTPTTTNAEKAVSYAALILADESIAITPDKLQAILKAAKIEDVEPIWTTLFAKALEGKDVKDVLTTVGSAAVEKVEQTNESNGVRDEMDVGGGGDGEDVDEGSDDDGDMLGMGLFD